MLGGLAWLLLVPAAVLQRLGLLDYDGYNRLLAGPLLLFLVALLTAPRALMVPGRSVRAGFGVAAVGVGLLLVGNVVEFYGVLLQDERNAYAAARVGEADHWVGSDIGWIIFGIGMLVLLVGGGDRRCGSAAAAHAALVGALLRSAIGPGTKLVS